MGFSSRFWPLAGGRCYGCPGQAPLAGGCLPVIVMRDGLCSYPPLHSASDQSTAFSPVSSSHRGAAGCARLGSAHPRPSASPQPGAGHIVKAVGSGLRRRAQRPDFVWELRSRRSRRRQDQDDQAPDVQPGGFLRRQRVLVAT